MTEISAHAVSAPADGLLPIDDRLEQVTDHAARTATEVEVLRATVAALQEHITRMDASLAQMRTAHQRSAERLERMASEFSASTKLDALEDRLGAAHAAGLKTAERVETLAGELRRVARVEDGIGNLRGELAERLATLAEEQRAAVEGRTDPMVGQLEATRRKQDELEERVNTLELLRSRIAEAEARGGRVAREINAMSVRLDEVAAAREKVEEIAKRTEQDTAARTQELARSVDGLREEVVVWRERIEGQDEAVRAAKTIAEKMRAEAAHVREDQGRTAEAQRVAEARVEHAIAGLRKEQADEWANHDGARQREREMDERDRAAREVRHREALAAALESVEMRLDSRISELETHLDRDGASLDALRRVLHENMVRQRDWHEEALRDLEAEMPGSAQPALLEEKRRALRRSLRARRDGS